MISTNVSVRDGYLFIHWTVPEDLRYLATSVSFNMSVCDKRSIPVRCGNGVITMCKAIYHYNGSSSSGKPDEFKWPNKYTKPSKGLFGLSSFVGSHSHSACPIIALCTIKNSRTQFLGNIQLYEKNWKKYVGGKNSDVDTNMTRPLLKSWDKRGYVFGCGIYLEACKKLWFDQSLKYYVYSGDDIVGSQFQRVQLSKGSYI